MARTQSQQPIDSSQNDAHQFSSEATAYSLQPTASSSLLVRRLGIVEYEPTWRAMQAFTEQRGAHTPDELWLLEHPPVFTQGMNGKPEHVLAAGDIPVVKIDRGGQVTYHGPGQLVAYPLLDLNRLNLGVRDLVIAIENAIVATVACWDIRAVGKRDAPGVYVDGRKLASIGLRIRRGCSYHGLALNVAMDLEPFSRINPCGFAGLQVTQLSDLGGPRDVGFVGDALAVHLEAELGRKRDEGRGILTRAGLQENQEVSRGDAEYAEKKE